ncbi:hypothetical protein QJS10_CPA06g01387 [Acorus calamus]|uniref:Uncharacterized protein n=1 Tax=Acorus calamus TaxID=4465 RepID=A0AAV9EIP9_ACOCL|nr:hypothetical protein QJS10_CPA06g01387 [Acorus calamus]
MGGRLKVMTHRNANLFEDGEGGFELAGGGELAEAVIREAAMRIGGPGGVWS